MRLPFFGKQRRPAKGLVWGGLTFAPAKLEPHYMIMGTTGSGKSMNIRMLMRSALFDEEGKLARRALIYDPKLDFYPVLRGFGIPPEQIKVLHPLDDRCVAWDVARDISDPVAVRQFAATLCPSDERNANQFFSDAAQDILMSIINVFRKGCGARGERWFLNDVVEATSNPDRLEAVLRKEPDGCDKIRTYLRGSERTALAIRASIRTRISKYAEIGALWLGRNPFSLTDWVEDITVPSILLVPTDEKHRESLDPINRALFRRATELALSRENESEEEQEKNPIWFFLDELRLARVLHGLEDLLLKGRSKGVRCVLGMQSIEGLQHVYGEMLADDLLGACGNKAILRLDSPSSMRWASAYFAEVEFQKETDTEGVQYSYHGTSHSRAVSRSEDKSPSMLPIEFREFRTARAHRGITGVFCVSEVGTWRGTIPADFVAAKMGVESEGVEDRGFRPRPAADQERRMWTDADHERLEVKKEPDGLAVPAKKTLEEMDDDDD